MQVFYSKNGQKLFTDPFVHLKRLYLLQIVTYFHADCVNFLLNSSKYTDITLLNKAYCIYEGYAVVIFKYNVNFTITMQNSLFDCLLQIALDRFLNMLYNINNMNLRRM